MGNLTAEILAEEFDLSVGLREHITHNHYPPLPSAYVDIARHAINVYNNTADLDYLIELPQDLQPRPILVQWVDELPHVSVGTLIEILHLDPWLLDPENEDFIWYTDDQP
jgi:uncharacterized phage-associated protein